MKISTFRPKDGEQFRAFERCGRFQHREFKSGAPFVRKEKPKKKKSKSSDSRHCAVRAIDADGSIRIFTVDHCYFRPIEGTKQ